jgi:hypothetical protein
MTDLSLDASQETRITVMQLKIERLEEKQDELRERLKVVEKWVIGAAAVLAAGTTVIGFATNISNLQVCFRNIGSKANNSCTSGQDSSSTYYPFFHYL